jgi:hypothetical protein
MRTLLVALTVVAALAPLSAQERAAPPQFTLDLEYLRSKVQPLLLHYRRNLAR